MKFNKKKMISLAIAAMATVSAFSLGACDLFGGANNGGNTPTDPNAFVMEAEYVSFAGLVGGGHSNEQYEESMIYGNGTQAEKDLGWSNGYFVSATHKADICLTFNFTSDVEVSNATIVLRLGSEMGNLTFNPDNFEVKLNGEAIDYNPMYITNSPVLEEMKFVDKTIANNAKIKAGDNTITLTVLANTLSGGTTAGPIIDCVKITANANLSWKPLTDNIEKRDAGI